MTKHVGRLSLLASFGVYLIPVVGPHFVSLWGIVLWREVTHGERSFAWLAADLALAFGLQSVAALILGAVLRRGGGWRFAWLVVGVPALFVILELLYMVTIPAAFLIDEDSSPELRTWEVECTVPEAGIVPVRSGVELGLERNRVVWIARGPGLSQTALLAMPDCDARTIPLDSPHPGGGLQWVTPGGAALFTRWDRVTAEQSYWYLSGDGEERQIEPPAMLRYWLPALSTDGRTLAWISREVRADGSSRQAITLRDANGEEKVITLPETISGSLDLVSFEIDPPRLTLSASNGEVSAVDGEGQLVWGPVRLDGIEQPSWNFRRVGEGWVAWDGFREDGPYRIVWSLSEGNGHHEVPRGRSITSVAVHPGGKLIGVSVSPAYNIGSVRDSIFVLGAKNGREVYRRYLPSYSRSQIAFLGASFFAVSLHDEERALIEVLRVDLLD